jgi:TonB family protein
MFKSLAIVIAGCALLAAPMPAQSIDAPGVTVDLGGAVLMHRSGVPYPQNLLAQQGTVNVQVTLDAKGNVADAQVLSGPTELRRTVLESVLQWHFAPGNGSTRQVSVTFQTPPASAALVTAGSQAPQMNIQMNVVAPGGSQPPSGGVLGGILSSGPAGGVVRIVPSVNDPQKLAGIEVSGFNEQLKAELLAALPVHQGDTISRDSLPAIASAARQYDEHLSVSLAPAANGEVTLRITGPGAVPSSPANVASWPGLRVDSATQAARVIRKVMPQYPPIARQARIQDHVILNAQIGPDGTMQNLAVVSGHPLLRQAALEAVRQWVFQPTLLNGQPVPVVTQIDINFTLQD